MSHRPDPIGETANFAPAWPRQWKGLKWSAALSARTWCFRSPTEFQVLGIKHLKHGRRHDQDGTGTRPSNLDVSMAGGSSKDAGAQLIEGGRGWERDPRV
eukprot:3940043-Rhodomonas_salina.1